MQKELLTQTCETPRYRVRELVCVYRVARDHHGRVVHVPSLSFTDSRVAARTLAPLMAEQPVETFGVACLSAKYRLLAWHVVSRGTRDSTPVSIPDVFLPACVTAGAVALLVVHNHPSGDPTPSPDDAALTRRLRAAADLLDITLVDHLILGDEQRYFSFREAGLLGATSIARDTLRGAPRLNDPGHHVSDSRARLSPVKALRFASTPLSGASALTGASVEPRTPHLRDVPADHGHGQDAPVVTITEERK
jgi:DNA repair protein RadC